MKKKIYNFYCLTMVFCLISLTAFSQEDRTLQHYRNPDQRGLNVFEPPKEDSIEYTGFKVRLGGSFALQFQGLDHYNNALTSPNPDDPTINDNELIAIGSNFNLATANLDLDVQLEKGVRLHLRTYLSSRHHPEAYVKGGYLQVDNLDFIKEGLLSELMSAMTVKVGHMEINYGDAHFRRTDNAMAIYNPFVGNYIMDAFTTELGAEVYYRKNWLVSMLGITNGKLNQAVTNPNAYNPSIVAKFGYDKQLNDDFRLRLMSSVYTTSKASPTWLYGGDRAGSRYYLVMENTQASTKNNFTSGRYNPGFSTKLTAFMFNPFVKYKGLEVFGVLETSTGQDFGETENRTWNQYGVEALYRFGKKENAYAGFRFNQAAGKEAHTRNDVDINRIQLGLGWFMTKNILAKLEYVGQTYNGFDNTNILHEGGFDGVMLEAVIAF